jgi:hypothetical protein
VSFAGTDSFVVILLSWFNEQTATDVKELRSSWSVVFVVVVFNDLDLVLGDPVRSHAPMPPALRAAAQSASPLFVAVDAAGAAARYDALIYVSASAPRGAGVVVDDDAPLGPAITGIAAADATVGRPGAVAFCAVAGAPGGRLLVSAAGALGGDYEDVRAVGDAAAAGVARAVAAGAKRPCVVFSCSCVLGLGRYRC